MLIARVVAAADKVDWCDEPIATAWQRLDEDRRRGGIAERFADALDGGIEACLEVHEGVVGPELLLKSLTRDQIAALGDERDEQAEWLIGKNYSVIAARQFARAQVECELAESNGICGLFHQHLLRFADPSRTAGRRFQLFFI
jgi:hypothetical protein